MNARGGSEVGIYFSWFCSILSEPVAAIAEIFQESGDFCLNCWQERTYPNLLDFLLIASKHIISKGLDQPFEKQTLANLEDYWIQNMINPVILEGYTCSPSRDNINRILFNLKPGDLQRDPEGNRISSWQYISFYPAMRIRIFRSREMRCLECDILLTDDTRVICHRCGFELCSRCYADRHADTWSKLIFIMRKIHNIFCDYKSIFIGCKVDVGWAENDGSSLIAIQPTLISRLSV
jgi:hypothetical protein